MRSLLFTIAILCSLASVAQKSKPLTTIAFGSCDHQYNPNKIWKEVNKENPQLWIWGGDIIYGDSENMDTLRYKYSLQNAQPGYQQLKKSAMITGTYDDHDFGVNDGGKNFKFKKESRDILFEFLEVPAKDKARKHKGAYSSYVYGPKNKCVKVINLDTRYFRDSLERENYINPATNKTEYRYKRIEGRDILGEAQWAWLEKELNNSKAQINIINSSIQVVSEQHRFEKWANFPTAHKRLYDLISRAKAKGIIILSGDRHTAELSKIHLEGMNYPLYDLSSSGMTHSSTIKVPEVNQYRVGELIGQRNFGLIKIDWSSPKPQVTYRIIGKDNVVLGEHRLAIY